jgi:hypothetical protein
MKADPELPTKFAKAVLNELALIRAELISQRKLLVELLSRNSKEPRRKIKHRLYQDRLRGPFEIAPALKLKVGFEAMDESP